MGLTATVFGVVGGQTNAAIMGYDSLYGDYRRGKLSFTQKAKFILYRKTLEARLELIEVTPDDEYADIHGQLVGKDVVHEFGARSVEELKKYRLGGKKGNKTAYALIDPVSRTVLSAIYVNRSTKTSDNQDEYQHIRNDIDEILAESTFDIDRSDITATIFFSISRMFKMAGEGEMLIAKLHEKLNKEYSDRPDITFATLSPLRGLNQWLADQGVDFKSMGEDLMFNAAINFLVKGKDNVKRFHLSNGSTIGRIHKGVGTDQSKDAVDGCGFMVSYIYDRNPYALLTNAKTFSMNKISERFSNHILQYIQKTPKFDSLAC